ncbi:hypothetical protein CKAN_01268200 [Cinnamomum micranthum f. kanehirae]|uniref:Uncharacterized protein n=1 Tax=Cinnamomum micranthum f. kanehirae TaxID=337451 RepID=A0A3S3MPR9_9MAGN|nr:hypothetical protein CKAN_01268200 [Cinnamomum micranthum f. kanehirae]
MKRLCANGENSQGLTGSYPSLILCICWGGGDELGGGGKFRFLDKVRILLTKDFESGLHI